MHRLIAIVDLFRLSVVEEKPIKLHERSKQFQNQLRHEMWQSDRSEMSAWRWYLLEIVRVGYAVIRDLTEGQLTLRAMSLVYSTLLSLAPLIAVSFSVLKAFGVQNQLEPALESVLSPLGDGGDEITVNIVNFVDNINFGVLGGVGLAVLFYTVISLMQKIETSFNYTWRLTGIRPFSQRFSDYLSVLMIGPVLVFAALGLSATMLNANIVTSLSAIEPFGTLLRFVTLLLPFFLIIAAFTFIYIFIPNTKVKLKPAFIGGLVSGILWQALGWGFASFVVTSANYTAIYSAFATLMFFLIWLYLGWVILLTGASIAFYVQHPGYTSSPHGDLRLSPDQQEKIAMMAMQKISRDFYAGTQNTAGELASAINISEDVAGRVLATLQEANLINQSHHTRPRYFPALPLEKITVKTVLDAVRYSRANRELGKKQPLLNSDLKQLFDDLDNNRSEITDKITFKELALADESAKLTP